MCHVTMDSFRARLQSYIPHECPQCAGSGEDPEFKAWWADYGLRFDRVVDEVMESGLSHVKAVDAWDDANPEAPFPGYAEESDHAERCGACGGSGKTDPRGLTPQDLLDALDLLSARLEVLESEARAEDHARLMASPGMRGMLG